MFKRFLHLTTIVILMLAISVSFAWMMDVTAPSGHYPVIRFDEDNKLYIASNDVDIDLLVEENDEYQPLFNSKTKYEADDLYSVSNSGPGSSKKFKLVIKNNTDAELNMSVILSEFEMNCDLFLPHVYLGVFYTKGFYDKYVPPKTQEFALNDENKATFKTTIIDEENNVVEKEIVSYQLFDSFKIPGNYSTVEIGFYIRIGINIDSNVVNDLQNKYLYIKKMSFIII